ncbi:DEAD/DEAH box helicase family protein [Candidatus Bathyarchaeota archaeon A05DMB-2]|nr:DEAD/DEAH box helicase family protein [Candidatus Bathyarchaeota archaeon A05DMB-2]
MSLKKAGVTGLSFEGRGERIARGFYVPVLKQSIAYDRATGYFSVESLVHAASGVAGLIENGGRMRLILGAHDVPKELWEAYQMGLRSGKEIVEEVARRIAEGLDKVEDVLVKRRLEALAWMFNKGILEVKVVLPRHVYLGQTGIFHYKLLIFKDKEGNVIAAEGSANETEPAYTVNGERIVVFYSWREGDKERVADLVQSFERIWNAEHPDFEVFNLPEAVYRAIVKFEPRAAPSVATHEPKVEVVARGLLPACRFVKILPRVRCLAHMGLGPVRLYPHQARAVSLARERYPFRVLFADEVGLGKTIEAGACIKLLWVTGYVRRVLVLAPKNVTRQWWDELRGKFGLPAYLFKPPNSFLAPDGKTFPVYGNPFDAVDLVVASWHYVRGRRGSEPELFKAKAFDLVLIDEAHAARVTRSEFASPRPTRLNELAMGLSALTPHVFLLTATPLQLNELEMLDLLRILGLGGPWVHEDAFKRYYVAMNKSLVDRSEDDWLHLFGLVSWFAGTYLEDRHREVVVNSFLWGSEAKEFSDVLARGRVDVFRNFLRGLDSEGRDRLDRVLRGLMPTSWFLIRNTRERLKKAGYRFPERRIVNRDVVLDGKHADLLSELNDYLANYYDVYRSFLRGDERRGFGLIRAVYHQRFVSSFASAYQTVKRRREALEALLEGDEERLLKLVSDMMEDFGEDADEEDVLEAVRAAVERARGLVERELEKLRGLEASLVPYSRAVTAADDPKLREIQRVVQELREEGRKVLVFSKFTDTVDVVRDFLGQWLGADRVGTYTGRGGEVWDSQLKAWRVCEKEEVRRALEKQVDVLVCSEAASEGLNLQAASAVVNVDMPWNPARVEQRIGRVDRIGQSADVVKVVNVWYPDSYEARMYRVLFERQHIWWIIVGPASGIIAQRLVEAFEGGLSGASLQRRIVEVVEQVEQSKDEAVKLTRIFPDDIPLEPTFVEVEVPKVLERFVSLGCEALGMRLVRRDDLLFVEPLERLPEGVRAFVEDGLSLMPGKPDALVPGHPFVQWLASELELFADLPEKVPFSVYGVGGEDGLLDVYVMEPDGRPVVVRDAGRVVELFRRLVDLAEGGVD